MASERMLNFRAVLCMLLGAAVLIVVGKALGIGGGGKPDPQQSTPKEPTPVIQTLCGEVHDKVQSTGNPNKYTSVCADAMRAWDRDQTDRCVSKLEELSKLLNDAGIASVPQPTIGQACRPKHVDA